MAPARKQRSALRMGFFVWLFALGFACRTTPVQSQIEPVPDEEGEETEPEPIPRPPAVEADELEEVTLGRLAALPIAAQARLMATRQAVAERVEAGARGVYVAYVHGEIELGIAHYIERSIEEAERNNAALLIFEVETPGGRVDAAVMMRDDILASEVPTIAFVNHRAWSAGALISLPNDLIVVADGASIGAATPVQMGGGGMQPVEEKIVSALRSEFRATAETTGRSAEIAESMVDADIAVGGVIPQGRLLTLTTREAIDVGIAEARANELAEVQALVGVEGHTVTIIEENWSETLVRILTSSAVSGILMALGMLGIFFELTSPGFGWAGGMGIACLLLFFTGHLLVDLAGLEEVLLFLAGVALLGVEIFVLPGFGVAGVLGIAAIGASMTMALINLDIDINLSAVSVGDAVMRVVVSLAVTLVGAALVIKFLPRTPLGRRLVLAEASASGTSIPNAPEEKVGVGAQGEALTVMRPFGRARFGMTRVEVTAEGGMIKKGETIVVTRIEGSRVEVREVKPPTNGEKET